MTYDDGMVDEFVGSKVEDEDAADKGGGVEEERIPVHCDMCTLLLYV